MKIMFISAAVVLMSACTSRTFEGCDFDCRVEAFRGGARSAVSFTFDDGSPNQFAKAVPLFDSHGLHLTLFLTTDWVGNWQAVRDADASGHEIACHTLSHPNLSELTPDSAATQMFGAQQLIADSVRAGACRTIAYPFCAPADSALVASRFFAARHCQGYIETSIPQSFMNISSIGCGDQSGYNSAPAIEALFAQAADTQGWCVLLFHGIDDDGGYSPIASADLERLVGFVASDPQTYWVDSFGNVAMYARERRDAQITDVRTEGNRLSFVLDDGLDDALFDMPLTLRCRIPAGTPHVEVTQTVGGQTVGVAGVRVDEADGSVVFEALPNGGRIDIKI